MKYYDDDAHVYALSDDGSSDLCVSYVWGVRFITEAVNEPHMIVTDAAKGVAREITKQEFNSKFTEVLHALWKI